MSDEAPPPYPGPKKEEESTATPSGQNGEAKKTEEPFDNSKLPPPPPYSAVPGAELPPNAQIFIAGLQTPITISPNSSRGIPLTTNSNTEQPEKIENYLLLSVCSMVFCCFPLGVLATLLSCQVGILFQRGDYLHARIISQRARHVASMAIMIGCFTIFFEYFRRYNIGINYDNDDVSMHPKVFGDDVDYISSTTFENVETGAAFEPVDPFSGTKIVDSMEPNQEIKDYFNNDDYFGTESESFSMWDSSKLQRTIDRIHEMTDKFMENSDSSYDSSY